MDGRGGRPALTHCYVCDRRFRDRQLVRIGGNENIIKNQIAITRRDELGHPPLELHNETRLCTNCNISILQEITLLNEDPTCIRLNVLTQTSNNTCVICNAHNNLHRLSVKCRVNVFIETTIFIPTNVRSCLHHLDENGLLLKILLPGLRSINRPRKVNGPEMLDFLNHLRQGCIDKAKPLDTNLTEEEFKCIAPITKEQFEELFTFCDPVMQNGKLNYISKKDLLTFLCKMRQGLSDEFLKVIFNYNSRQNVSSIISYVRRSLSVRFVQENIGPASMTRQEYIAQHVTGFSNALYNPQPNEPRAIAIVDSTYAFIHKSSCFRVLRHSYSVHKHRHLLKPTLVVAPDGFILAIFGPYFSDSANNDAQILRDELQRDGDSLRNWFQNGDILLVDRGYRDAVPFLQQLGIEHQMPALVPPGQRQLSTEEANNTRIITKSRWIVEARNGHLRSIFKFLRDTFNVQHAKHVGDFYRIAGAIINKYHPIIHMEGATIELAQQMLLKAQTPNVVQARVEIDNLTRRNGQWRRLHHNDIPDFPILDLNYLRDLTVGIYQINLAPSYVQDKIVRDNDEEFQVDELINEQGFLRVRVFSRFRNSTKHQIFIAYNNENENGAYDADDLHELIAGYYCTCQSGARTLGTCAHVTCILWFLGYARHHNNIKYPGETLLNTTLDARNEGEENIDIQVFD